MITPLAVTKRILKVPDYKWYKGCTPTSAAMVLRFSYEDLLEDITTKTLIEDLATAMKTNSSGGTRVYDINLGIIEAISNYEDGANGRLYCETDYSTTFAELKTQINGRFPFLVTVLNCTATSPAYPDGFGNHTMACVGYNISGTSSYMVVHDTSVGGNVYVNYDGSVVGIVTGTYVRPGKTSQG
ncbi:C39 family peptidase [Desulfosporosinus nitroreducens]|uniref:C39 family peptidase n=1 Tax=Desulfosporosinus nitroreducens TaxID=2018668 RepID=UPI00207C7818|nr:C39 family peptidase [Desulfosporosinus nitroreducens]MCO1601593.1 C39 family peptidase [Desulfosporosinus nitroreducens]